MTPVNKFTPQGLPDFLIEDIPPVSKYPALQITRPEIYYGELSGRYVIVNSKQKEFDYPSGSNNVYTHYQGDGGNDLPQAFGIGNAPEMGCLPVQDGLHKVYHPRQKDGRAKDETPFQGKVLAKST